MGARTVKKAVPFAVLAAAAAIVAAQSLTGYPSSTLNAVHLLRDSVQTLEAAYIMLPPEPVLNDVESFSWSPTGEFLAVTQRGQEEEVALALKDLTLPAQPVDESRLGILDARSQNVTWLKGIDYSLGKPEIRWIRGADYCVLYQYRQSAPGTIDPPQFSMTLSLIDPKTGQAKPLAEATRESFVELEEVGNGRALAIITDRRSGGDRTFAFYLDKSGKRDGEAPEVVRAVTDGWHFVVHSPKLGPLFGRERTYAVLMPDGSLQPIDVKIMREALQADEDERNSAHLLVSQGGEKRTEAWLLARPSPGKQPRALICALAEDCELSPTNKEVAYTSQRMLWIRSIVSMDPEKYALLREEAVKNDAIDTAKMVGTAIMMYSMDYDDVFPTQEFENVLSPYTKDSARLGQFTFQMPQGGMQGKDPSKTVLGYVQTDSGRATVYADGNVVWGDRQP